MGVFSEKTNRVSRLMTTRKLISWWYGIWEDVFLDLWINSWPPAHDIFGDILMYNERKREEYQN